MKCYNQTNDIGGFASAHNGRCFRGIPAKEIHGPATHHVLSGSACMHVCDRCSRDIAKRADKDTIITEIAA